MNNEDVRFSCDTSQFPELQFCGPHDKSHGARYLIKQYHILFDPLLGHGKCEMHQILCECVACTNILDKTWYPDVSHTQQKR